MNHIMLDCYGCNPTLLENVKYINKIMNELPFVLSVIAVNPPTLVPYYYGKIQEDDGLSAYVILEGGHLTIHTFPYRKCYFLDIYAESNIDTDVLINYLQENLSFNYHTSIINERDRNQTIFHTSEYNEEDDFGPHVLAEIKVNRDIHMEELYDFLEQLVVKIGMTPIIRPSVLKSTIHNHRYLSGITMIAESHISLHYDRKQQVIYADIFSCCSFDYSMVTSIYESFGKVVSYEVVARGTKHYSIVNNNKKDIEKVASEQWKKSIYKD